MIGKRFPIRRKTSYQQVKATVGETAKCGIHRIAKRHSPQSCRQFVAKYAEARDRKFPKFLECGLLDVAANDAHRFGGFGTIDRRANQFSRNVTIREKMKYFVGAILIVGIATAVVGCNDATTVKAVPRDSPYQPVFGVDEAADADAEVKRPSKNELDVRFFHEDHFACLQIDVPRVIHAPDFADLPWESVEEQLAKLIGQDNADLKKISRAWVLIDRERLNLTGGSLSPGVLVIEFFEPFNQAQLDAAGKELASASDNESGFGAFEIDDRRIVLGDDALVSKLRRGDGDHTGLATKFSQIDLKAEVNGILVIGPIRSLLQTIFDMAAGFTENGRELASLPELTQYIDLQFSVQGENMLQANIYLEDEQLSKDLAQLINESLNSSGASGMPPMGAFPGQASEAMIPTESTDVLKEVGADIRERGLLTVNANQKTVTVKLKRPEKINQLLTAVFNDGKKQAQLAVRVERFKRIGEALRKYEEQFGQLPSSESIFEDPNGIPNQLSWRVALLPQLGEQELYDQFDFSQPWDSPVNLEVAKQIPDVFKPDAQEDPLGRSRTHIVFGEDSIYQQDRVSPKLSEIKDKKIWTAIVIEGGESTAVAWTKPGGLNVDALASNDFGQNGENGVLIINSAFKPRIVKRRAENLSSVFTIDGGETMTRNDFLNSPLLGR